MSQAINKTLFPTLLLIHFIIAGFFSSLVYGEDTESFSQQLQELTQKKFSKKKTALENIAVSQHSKSIEALNLLLAGELFYLKKGKAIVTRTEQDGKYLATDFLTGEQTGPHSKRKIKKSA